MGFWARLTAFFGLSRAAASTPTEPRLSRGTQVWRRDQAAMLQAFEDHPHLHTVVRARAEAAGAIADAWQVFEIVKPNTSRADLGLGALRGRAFSEAIADLQKEKTLKPQVDSELLRLLRRPSPLMSGVDFWELTSEHDDLVGEFIWLKGARRGRRPTVLHLMVPTWLSRMPEPGAREQVFTFTTPGSTIVAPVEDVIWRKRHSPRDPYGARGVGTAYVLRDELQLDELLAAMARGRAANRNYPDLLIGLLAGNGPGSRAPGQAEVDIVTKQLEQKHGGVDRVGQAHVIGGDFKAQPLGHTLVESQYMETRRFSRDTSMQTFRMPPEVAGVLDNANRSTIDVAEDLFARQSTVPKQERWRATIQDEVAPDFGDNLVVGYRSPVPADREYEAGFFKSLPAAMTINEIRQRAGLPPRDDGNVFYKAPGATPVAGSPSSPTAQEKP